MILAKDQNSNYYSQGSAVAVSSDMLFTNCHVVLNKRNKPFQVIALANDSLNKKTWLKAIIYKMDPDSDRCILKSVEKNGYSWTFSVA